MARPSHKAVRVETAPRLRAPVARDGLPYVGGGAALALAAAWAGWPWAAWPLGLATAFSAFFFRDPERRPPPDPDAVLSPADGKVVQIRPEENGGARVSVFLSVFNVHINRSPVKGRVVGAEYQAGRFRAAFRRAASAENERNTVRILPAAGPGEERGEVAVRQIAGVLARRIVCWARTGDELEAGERLGLIKFGSRVDLFLPPQARVVVRERDRVRGGLDVVARWEKGRGA